MGAWFFILVHWPGTWKSFSIIHLGATHQHKSYILFQKRETLYVVSSTAALDSSKNRAIPKQLKLNNEMHRLYSANYNHPFRLFRVKIISILLCFSIPNAYRLVIFLSFFFWWKGENTGGVLADLRQLTNHFNIWVFLMESEDVYNQKRSFRNVSPLLLRARLLVRYYLAIVILV